MWFVRKNVLYKKELKFAYIYVTREKAECEKAQVRKKAEHSGGERKTIRNKTASGLSNKLLIATISRLFISAGSHWSSAELYPRNNSTIGSYRAKSMFRFQFRFPIKAPIEKFKRYEAGGEKFIPPFRMARESKINYKTKRISKQIVHDFSILEI